MAQATVKAIFPCTLEEVWQKVTSLEDFSWRSDLKDIEVLDGGKHFIEHTVDGYQTTFTITTYDPMKKYAFDMENDMMKGSWIGLFSYEEGKTSVEFTEDVTAKKIVMKPFVGTYLKKQQAAYIDDLKKDLSKTN